MIIVTGGAGFIGSHFILNWFKTNADRSLLNIDKLTYAADLKNLDSLKDNENYFFIQADIADTQKITDIFKTYQPRAIINFAAESHVDRSILGPAEFIQTNIIGTFNLLETARQYWNDLSADKKKQFRFLQISTDEVYGSLEVSHPAFSETTPYAPNSPYSASKASADHLVRAYFHTYGLPVITTHCSNNYGPHQVAEKLIPFIILNALSNKSLPIYGDGLNIRDWLYVKDHCEAIELILEKGKLGETYNIGGNSEKNNITVVKSICNILDNLAPEYLGNRKSYQDSIQYVKDRLGHDRRYAIDASKIQRELGWSPKENFESGLRRTIEWYLTQWKQKNEE